MSYWVTDGERRLKTWCCTCLQSLRSGRLHSQRNASTGVGPGPTRYPFQIRNWATRRVETGRCGRPAVGCSSTEKDQPHRPGRHVTARRASHPDQVVSELVRRRPAFSHPRPGRTMSDALAAYPSRGASGVPDGLLDGLAEHFDALRNRLGRARRPGPTRGNRHAGEDQEDEPTSSPPMRRATSVPEHPRTRGVDCDANSLGVDQATMADTHTEAAFIPGLPGPAIRRPQLG